MIFTNNLQLFSTLDISHKNRFKSCVDNYQMKDLQPPRIYILKKIKCLCTRFL